MESKSKSKAKKCSKVIFIPSRMETVPSMKRLLLSGNHQKMKRLSFISKDKIVSFDLSLFADLLWLFELMATRTFLLVSLSSVKVANTIYY